MLLSLCRTHVNKTRLFSAMLIDCILFSSKHVKFIFEQIQVIGSYGGRARQDLPKLIRLAETGIFNLGHAVSRTYTFDEAGKAFQDLNEGKIVGRAVIEII